MMKEWPMKIKCNDITYELYKSKPFMPFKENFEEMTVAKKIRFFLQACRGMIVYYMKKNNRVIGYIALEPGAGFRYPDSKKNDWIISPYTIHPNERGKGYGTLMLSDFCASISNRISGDILAEVRLNNLASIRAMEKAGFKFSHYAKNTKYLKRYIKTDKPSDYLVYILQR